jgi:hypothetical protein
MPPFNFNKFKKNAQATIRAWQPGPPGLSLPQPPPMVIEENANAGNNLLASITLERQSGLPAAAAPFVPAAASTLNPHVAPYVPAAVLQEKAEVNALLREAANQRSGGKRRGRKSRKTRKAQKTRKNKKSRRTYK